MKRIATLLLAASLLLGLLCGCAASPAAPEATPEATAEPGPEVPAVSEMPAAAAVSAPKPAETPAAAVDEFRDAVAGQAFAVGMCYFDGGHPEGTMPDSPEFYVGATGWYTAWRCRTADIDMIPLAEAEAFQRSLGSNGDFFVWPEYEEYGLFKRMKTADGTVNVCFPTHTERLNALLGVELETRLEADGGNAVNFSVIRHFSNEDTAEKTYRMLFRPNPDSGSPFTYLVTDVTLPPTEAKVDPELGFSWDLLMQQNSLRFLLTQNPAIRIGSNFFDDMATWLINVDGNLLVMNVQPDYYTGTYRGCYFDYEKTADGTMRARISSFDPKAGDWEANEGFITDYFTSCVTLHLKEMKDDLICAWAMTDYDSKQEFELDKGTLALKREIYYYDPKGEPQSIMTLSYPRGKDLPDLSFLDGWDRPLRRVHLVWEDWYDGSRHVREETVELPADWEYIPAEGRYGDYTIYMNAGYTQTYFYPGDNVDYTLYLTTAKG